MRTTVEEVLAVRGPRHGAGTRYTRRCHGHPEGSCRRGRSRSEHPRRSWHVCWPDAERTPGRQGSRWWTRVPPRWSRPRCRLLHRCHSLPPTPQALTATLRRPSPPSGGFPAARPRRSQAGQPVQTRCVTWPVDASRGVPRPRAPASPCHRPRRRRQRPAGIRKRRTIRNRHMPASSPVVQPPLPRTRLPERHSQLPSHTPRCASADRSVRRMHAMARCSSPGRCLARAPALRQAPGTVGKGERGAGTD